MAQAVLEPLLEDAFFNPHDVLGIVGSSNSVGDILNNFSAEIRVVSAQDSLAEEVWSAPIKLLAVKPQQLHLIKEKQCALASSNAGQKPLLVSILAGVKLSKLQTLFPSHCCVRAVPNTPSLVRAGLTGLSWGQGVSQKQRSLVETIFKPIGEVLDLPEDHLDAFLALTSSGPAYVALIAEALADGAVAAGLPRSLANYLAVGTLAGSAKLLKEKDLHPGELKDMVASPGGTTIAALRHVEMAGFRSALIEAVVLAAQRSREIG